LALYRFSAEIIGRGKGYSATAAAAYRAGERIEDERTGEVHDYRRRDGVLHTEILAPEGDTIVCRCEEVTAGDIRNYAKLGCLGPNQTKAFGRPGMGPCQGRYCGLTVTALLADARPPADMQGKDRV